MSHIAYISHRLNKIVVEIPRNADWAAAINFVIPSHHRKFREGMWYFHEVEYQAILAITKHYFPHHSNSVKSPTYENLEYNLGWQAKWAKFIRNSYDEVIVLDDLLIEDFHSVLFITKDAPPEIVQAAYRTLSKIHHPDQDGDPDVFKVIKEAYDAIKKGV